MIVDKFGRQFRNLRVSLTSACNYACSYCVPKGKSLNRLPGELTAEQLFNAIDLLKASAGVQQLRLTGGEPLIARSFDRLLSRLGELALHDVSLTTNGQHLSEKLPLILGAGINRINVSLDSLNPVAFRAIARGGNLDKVLAGIEQALAAGLKVKVNMVPMRRSNADQILPMLAYCLERGIELRFIELMRMGHLQSSPAFYADFIGMEELLEMISQNYDYVRAQAPVDSTAIRFSVVGGGYFGIIANESEPFCRSCTRLRLSADGKLYGCLSSSQFYNISHLLDQPWHRALPELQQILAQALRSKQDLQFTGGATIMKIIGG